MSKPALKEMTPAEVAKHNTADDLFIVVRGVVYDVTKFAKVHPGGASALIQIAG